MEEARKPKVNPFNAGVTYDQVLKDLGTKSVATHYKGVLTKEQIEWLTEDLEVFKTNQKSK